MSKMKRIQREVPVRYRRKRNVSNGKFPFVTIKHETCPTGSSRLLPSNTKRIQRDVFDGKFPFITLKHETWLTGSSRSLPLTQNAVNRKFPFVTVRVRVSQREVPVRYHQTPSSRSLPSQSTNVFVAM